MKELYELKDALLDELALYSRGRIDRSNLCDIDTLAHATKNICKIIESVEKDENSGDGLYSHRRSYGMRGNNWSNRSPQQPNYSYHQPKELADELNGMMHDAPDEQTKQDFQRLINKLSTM